jgi:hypothetical protein
MAAAMKNTSCPISLSHYALNPECIDACAPTEFNFVDVAVTVGLLCLSAMFSGLTLGLMGLGISDLQLVMANKETMSSQEVAEQGYATAILPLRRRGNLLLCTLLIGNTLVNAMIAVFSASFTGGLVSRELAIAAPLFATLHPPKPRRRPNTILPDVHRCTW